MKKHLNIRAPFSLILAGSVFFTSTCFAQISSGNLIGNGLSSEFFVGRELGKPLVSVNLISGVSKPGVYHVPIDTDLGELMAYAGGTVEKAELSDVSIRRRVGKNVEVTSIDLSRSFSRPGELPKLMEGDTVRIPVNQTLDRTLVWVLIVSGVFSSGLSIALMNQAAHNRN